MENQPLPPATVVPRELAPALSIVRPITRTQKGSGLIVLVNAESKGVHIKNGVPSPLQKWAEEGYFVVEVLAAALGAETDVLGIAIQALKADGNCDTDAGIGIVGYDFATWQGVSSSITQHSEIVAAVLYTDLAGLAVIPEAPLVPTLVHVAGKLPTRPKRSASRTVYDYPEQASSSFASPYTKDFHYASEAVSHTRNLTHLKPLLNGPYFDLEALWDEHTYYEFEVRDVEKTMNTMVQEPYVNHIPTLTGGIGRAALTAFYRDHFIFSNPKDTELELISRTVGIDRVVDEFLFKFTHDKVVDWLLPCVPPTHKYVEIPFMAVVNIRGDRLYHEHISWDQATALRQIGVLPERHEMAATGTSVDGQSAAKFSEIKLPVAGVEAAAKLRDKNAVPSNAMFHNDV